MPKGTWEWSGAEGGGRGGELCCPGRREGLRGGVCGTRGSAHCTSQVNVEIVNKTKSGGEQTLC